MTSTLQTIPATDGYPLGATFWAAAGTPQGVVVMHPATGVPQRIYQAFAQFLAERGYPLLDHHFTPGPGAAETAFVYSISRQESNFDPAARSGVGARGMMQLARETGLTREGLYKALSPEGNPSFATVMKVCKALRLRMHAEPV